jgi:hypothetical protein
MDSSDEVISHAVALPVGADGGTPEVFRNTIGQPALGLGRPNHAPAAVS